MNKNPDRRPAADSPTPSSEAPASPPLEDSSKGRVPALYTVENLDRWAAELRTVPQVGSLVESQLDALDNAARFLTDTAATLRAQAKARRDRTAAQIIERKRSRGRRRRK